MESCAIHHTYKTMNSLEYRLHCWRIAAGILSEIWRTESSCHLPYSLLWYLLNSVVKFQVKIDVDYLQYLKYNSISELSIFCWVKVLESWHRAWLVFLQIIFSVAVLNYSIEKSKIDCWIIYRRLSNLWKKKLPHATWMLRHVICSNATCCILYPSCVPENYTCS